MAAQLAAATRAVATPHWSMQVQLTGPLGAGKTTLVRHWLRALGIQGRIKSPTYAVLEPYWVALPAAGASPPGELHISHFDCYRLDDPAEFDEAGFRDVLAAPGLKLVEWPEKAAAALPPADLLLTLRPLVNGGRELHLQAATQAGQAFAQRALAIPPG